MMGSFNETCVLSGLNIEPGTPVQIMFLVQNPYRGGSQKFAERGCYIYDQWFLRTPPFFGVYDDYGRATYKKSCVTRLIEEVFAKDVIEQPFGFNRYHTIGTTPNPSIDELLEVASQGRLQIQRDYLDDKPSSNNLPENFPTWKKVRDILKKARFKIMTGQDVAGYNAQPIEKGIVAVTFNDFGKQTDKLQKAKEVISKTYDCKIMGDDYNQYLIVVPKEAFENPTILAEDYVNYLRETMGLSDLRTKEVPPLPVLSVMARQDVWDVYVNSDGYHNRAKEKIEEVLFEKRRKPNTLMEIAKKAGKTVTEDPKVKKAIKNMTFYLIQAELREFFSSLPYQIMLPEHIVHVVENKYTKKEKETLARVFTEASKVESTMAMTHQSWQIPTLGGQESYWQLRVQILEGIKNIAEKEYETSSKEME